MKVIEISTTAYNEENFYVITDINENLLIDALIDIVVDFRNRENEYKDFHYYNEDIEKEIKERFINCNYNRFEIINIDKITI